MCWSLPPGDLHPTRQQTHNKCIINLLTNESIHTARLFNLVLDPLGDFLTDLTLGTDLTFTDGHALALPLSSPPLLPTASLATRSLAASSALSRSPACPPLSEAATSAETLAYIFSVWSFSCFLSIRMRASSEFCRCASASKTLRFDQSTEILNKEVTAYLESNHIHIVVCSKDEHASIVLPKRHRSSPNIRQRQDACR
jgi:hypothetical protein